MGVAHPDVFFADSALYNNAYLVHELDGDYIKFKITEEVVDIVFPQDKFYFNSLVNYVSNIYQFANAALKDDFGNMFARSFESRYATRDFLTELARMLVLFKATYPNLVQGG